MYKVSQTGSQIQPGITCNVVNVKHLSTCPSTDYLLSSWSTGCRSGGHFSGQLCTGQLTRQVFKIMPSPPPLYSFKLDSICFKAKILYFTDGVQCRYIMHCRKTNFTRWVSQNDDDDKRRHIKLLKNKMLPVVGMESSSLALRSRCLSDCAILTQSKEFRFCL